MALRHCLSRPFPLLLVFALSCAAPNQRSRALAEVGGGPGRSVPALYEAFQIERAMQTLAHADRYYRAEGSEGYQAVLMHLRARLTAAGFGELDGYELDTVTMRQGVNAWTPISARLAMQAEGSETVLHAFDDQADMDRLLLPLGAPACEVSGRPVLALGDVEPGTILITDAVARADILRRAESRGAVAVLSDSMASYNVDPATGEPLWNAIRYRTYPRDATMPVGQISKASRDKVAQALEAGDVTLTFHAEVKREVVDLNMLVATIVGDNDPQEAVVLTSHLEYAGASDNASGFAATAEGAMALLESIESGVIERPARSMVFLFGTQIDQARAWLEQSERQTVGALTLLAAGDAASHNGSPLLFERPPDPGAVRPLHPDEHTQWGANPVEPESLVANGLAVIARSAMADVSGYVGGWRVSDHPWEGGSDHDVFLGAGVPAGLFWHFTPSWYHTSLDRLEVIDPEEMHRSGVVAVSTALAIADPDPADFAHYERALDVDTNMRASVALVHEDEELAQEWDAWSAGALTWLAELCDL